MSRFLHKIEHCSRENAEILHNHSKHSKLKIEEFWVDSNPRETVTIAVSFFAGQLGHWDADHDDTIFKLDNIDALTAYVRASFSNADLKDNNLYALLKLFEFDESLREYTQEFNSSYSYWKDDISSKAAAYMYIASLKVGALRADLITTWQVDKYDSLIALQNYAAKNSLWCSTAIITPRLGSFGTTHNKGKIPMPTPSYKRPQGNIAQNNHGNSGNFGGNGSKGISGNRKSLRYQTDTKADFKSPPNSHISDKKVKYNESASGFKSYDLGNKAKDKFTTNEYNKRRRKNLELILVRSATQFMVVPSQNLDCLRVL
jgi:hypothetical protein